MHALHESPVATITRHMHASRPDKLQSYRPHPTLWPHPPTCTMQLHAMCATATWAVSRRCWQTSVSSSSTLCSTQRSTHGWAWSRRAVCCCMGLRAVARQRSHTPSQMSVVCHSFACLHLRWVVLAMPVLGQDASHGHERALCMLLMAWAGVTWASALHH